MRIGFPRALVFFYFYPLWKTFFNELGIEVILSNQSSASLLHQGVKSAIPEICVPIKIFTGHVWNLLEQDVDYIFIPRLMNVEKDASFCPKFLGLPEMIRYTIPEVEGRILCPNIQASNEKMDRASDYKSFIDILGVDMKMIRKALRKASVVWDRFREFCYKGYTVNEASALALGELTESQMDICQDCDIKIGLLGYVYNIYDPLIGMDIVQKMRKRGVYVKTFEMVHDRIIEKKIQSIKKPLFWTFTNKLWGAADHFYQDHDIDGLIHVTAFGCGPDSLLGKIIELDSDEFCKPFMTIRVDEHTGESHLETRIEAFIDMIRRKKNKARGVGA